MITSDQEVGESETKVNVVDSADETSSVAANDHPGKGEIDRIDVTLCGEGAVELWTTFGVDEAAFGNQGSKFVECCSEIDRIGTNSDGRNACGNIKRLVGDDDHAR